MALKRYPGARPVVMGPDAARRSSMAFLGFANAVRRGAIGVVGASGTGTQQVSCLVHRLGAGISHAIGTGGHDLHEKVGGITMLQGLKRLARDEDTKVIVLVSKPPAPAVAREVIQAAKRAGKPVVINFIGAPRDPVGGNLFMAQTLEDAAVSAVTLSPGRKPSPSKRERKRRCCDSGKPALHPRPVQRGTFCY